MDFQVEAFLDYDKSSKGVVFTTDRAYQPGEQVMTSQFFFNITCYKVAFICTVSILVKIMHAHRSILLLE